MTNPEAVIDKQLNEFITEATEHLSLRKSLLDQNRAIIGKWPTDTFFATKDSTLKKNTAFVKKVRNFLDSQKESILSEFEYLNLSKYVEEVANAIVESKIKTTDIPFILKLCSAMHQRYSDFNSLFLDAWKKVFTSYKDVKNANVSKLRVDLVLFADLNTIGTFSENEGVRLLAVQLTALTNSDHNNFSNLGIIISFCRHCADDWLGVIPRRIRLLSEKFNLPVPRSKFLSTERQSKCRALFNDYLSLARRHLQSSVKDAKHLILTNRNQMEIRGEVSDERQERAEQLTVTCRKFYDSLSILIDLLDSEPLPDFNLMINEDSKTEDMEVEDVVQEDGDTQLCLFEDEDTRLFYESFPDIKAMVPAILYKESEQTKVDSTPNKEELDSSLNEDIDIESLETELDETLSKMNSEESANSDKEKPAILVMNEIEDDSNATAKVLMETFLTQLPNCINRDLIDKAAVDFCLNFNKRANRRRLAKALFTVPRTRYDLLPFYSRFVAALAPVMPDLVDELNSMLTAEFRWRVMKRDQINVESKLKVVRYIGELVKFKIYPAHQALSCLKHLLPQFVHHNIDMACALLDTCGRFLYRSSATHKRTKIYLDVMLRKKVAFHMDQRYSIMIENTYYYCNPPPSTRRVAESENLTEMMLFIRYLLQRLLDKTMLNGVLKMIRKIDWDDADLVEYTRKLFARAWEVRYTTINCLASILSGLALYHKDFTLSVVDNVIEDIRVGMELNLPTIFQRRMAMVKYLGLLYNYCIVDSPVIFKTLYSLLTFGVSLDINCYSIVDPPDSLFRIILICTLLETSGGFFDRGKKRRKLNIFIIYFQRYYWFKRSLPIWIQPTKPVKVKPSEPIKKDSTESNQIESTGQDSIKSPSELSTFPAFVPQAFPIHVEQQYYETLQQLHLNFKLATSYAQAQRLVSRLESRCLPRLARLKATYGLVLNDNGGDSNLTDKKLASNGRSGQPLIVSNQMDTIQEEDDIQLDEDDYVVDEDDFDDEDEDEEGRGGVANNEGEGLRLPSQQTYDALSAPDKTKKACLHHQTEDNRIENGDEMLDVEEDEDDDDVEEEEEDDDEEEEDRVLDDEEIDEQMHGLGIKPRFIDCQEDREFREALDRMNAENLLSVSGLTSTGGLDSLTGAVRSGGTLPTPDILRMAASKSSCQSSTDESVDKLSSAIRGLCVADKSNRDEDQSRIRVKNGCTDEKSDTIPFTLITRRGNRPGLVPLFVPDTVQFATRYMQVKAEERLEKAQLKQLVLGMHEAQKQEEMEMWNYLDNQDAMLAHQFPINANRDRGVKHAHFKGLADIGEVFGPSSRKLALSKALHKGPHSVSMVELKTIPTQF